MDGRDPNTGRFVKGWKGGGRPKGGTTKPPTTGEIALEHALKRDPDDPTRRTRLEKALDAVLREDAENYLRWTLRLAALR